MKKFKNLILLRTLSKAFSLGGVRLGYLLGDPKLVAEVRKVVLPSKGATPLLEKLLREGILIRNVTAPSLPNALRVTVGSSEENRLFLEALRSIF